MTTALEDLPDEILLNICQYLRQYHIIRAFLDLNNRLNCTISQFLQSLLISEDDYYQRHESRELLSIIGPYLHSLTVKHVHLSSSQISLASNIQELTFIRTQPDHIPPLENLTDLNIFMGSNSHSIDILLSNSNTLHSMYLSSVSPLTIPILSPPKFSTIKQLALSLNLLEDFVSLLRICPELTCLNVTLQNCNPTKTENVHDQSSIDTPSNLRIFSLRTTFGADGSFNQLHNVLKLITPKLEYLAIDIHTNDVACVNGQLWEHYLKEHRPDLKRFEFFMLIRPPIINVSDRLRLANILETFRNAYWSLVTPQNITGYYLDCYSNAVCIHTEIIPTVRRRRYFLN